MNSALGLFTAFHTIVSCLAILAGIPAIRDLITGRVHSPVTTTFLVTALVTSVTGFMFPFHGFTPAIGVGIIATLVLIWAFAARRSIARSAGWATQYAVAIVISEYFLVFVLVAQLFAKVPALNALAPHLKQELFGATQLVVLVAFVLIAVRGARSFRTRVAV
jgi:hypothetical protein